MLKVPESANENTAIKTLVSLGQAETCVCVCEANLDGFLCGCGMVFECEV